MTKVEEYKNNGGEGNIVVSNGEVLAIDSSSIPDVIGTIERIELSIEEPDDTPGVLRIEHVMLYDKDDKPLYDDQGIVDNYEYHSEEAMVMALAKNYGVSKDIIEISY